MYKCCLLLVLPLCLPVSSDAQNSLVNLSVIVKGNKNESKYWDIFTINSEDTAFAVFRTGRKTIIKGLPKTSYTITLVSFFNDRMETEVDLRGNQLIRFDLRNYYQMYSDTTSFFDLMTTKDTLRIAYEESSDWNWKNGFCALTKDSSNYFISFKLSDGSISTQSLNSSDLKELRDLELRIKSHERHNGIIIASTTYYLEMNNQILTESLTEFNLVGRIIDDKRSKR